MNKRKKLLAVGGLAVALVAIGGTALAATPSPVNGNVITGCYTTAAVNGAHALFLQNANTSCPSGTSAITWGVTGPAGPTGATGATGPQGPAGPQGAAGTTGAQGATGPVGPDGTSITTTEVFPPSPCTAGDTDIVIGPSATTGVPYGEVLTCNSSGTGWNDTGSSIEGPAGPAGAAGATGPAGPAGAAGATGPAGPAGSAGVTYDTGTLTCTGDPSGADVTCALSDMTGPDDVTILETGPSSPIGSLVLLAGINPASAPTLLFEDNYCADTSGETSCNLLAGSFGSGVSDEIQPGTWFLSDASLEGTGAAGAFTFDFASLTTASGSTGLCIAAGGPDCAAVTMTMNYFAVTSS
jgi:hypothetical protein